METLGVSRDIGKRKGRRDVYPTPKLLSPLAPEIGQGDGIYRHDYKSTARKYVRFERNMNNVRITDYRMCTKHAVQKKGRRMGKTPTDKKG